MMIKINSYEKKVFKVIWIPNIEKHGYFRKYFSTWRNIYNIFCSISHYLNPLILFTAHVRKTLKQRSRLCKLFICCKYRFRFLFCLDDNIVSLCFLTGFHRSSSYRPLRYHQSIIIEKIDWYTYSYSCLK